MSGRLWTRRNLLVGAGVAASSSCTRNVAVGPFDHAPSSVLEEVPLAELSRKLGTGELTSVQATQLYIERIGAIDRLGPKLNSLIELNPDATSIAAELDRERRRGDVRGPLHGVPILVKDNIDTADRMQTTAGSLALSGSIAAEDSGVARRLRSAGAVILGKTNLSEWANFRSTESTSGWSGRGGLTLNPYALDRNTCGSSAGSAVAAAASLCAAAVGTETNGSIVCPASINGLVGIKPTVGLVSQEGIIPISETQDTAGPLARSVLDAALLLDALADPGVRRQGGSYADRCHPGALRGARIGVARHLVDRREDVAALADTALRAMRSEGVELIELGDELPGGEPLSQASYAVLLYEFKAGLNRYLTAFPEGGRVRSLADVIAFNNDNADTELLHFGQEHFLRAEAMTSRDEPSYRAALALMQRQYRSEGIDCLIDEHRLDAIVAPTTGPAWLTDLVHGDSGSGVSSASYAARAGYPSITVPMGLVGGLPVGISLWSTAWNEARLIELAYSLERVIDARRPPTYAATTLAEVP